MEESKHFKRSELECSHTGDCKMEEEFMESLEKIRELYANPMRLSSAYRSVLHPVESRKDSPGAHTAGQAVDILVAGWDAVELLRIALNNPWVKGIGISQKGKWESRFIHLDTWSERTERAIWSY